MEPDSDSVFENDMESDNGSDFENDVEFDSVSEFMKLKPDQRAQILIFENQIHYVTMFGILENRRSNVDFDSLTASLPRGESMELTLLQIRWWLARVSVVPYEADPGSKQKQHQYSDLFGQSFESLEDLHYATKALAEFYESVTPRQRLYAAIIHYIPFVVFTRARKSDPGWRK